MHEIDLAEIAKRPDWKDILLSTVKEQNIDPWDVDIVKLVTSFVNKIKQMKELNLWIPANAILAASVLLRMKSDSWTLREREQELFIPPDFFTPFVSEQVDNVDLVLLSRETTRKITLDELLTAVEDVIKKERKKAVVRRKEPPVIPQYLLELSNPESKEFKQKVEEVYSKVLSTLDSKNMTLFTNILPEKTRTGVISTLMPLLYLANQQKIKIWQEKVFGEIFIVPVDT